MLDAYIIDAIRQEELDRESEFEERRIWLELPVPPVAPAKRDSEQEFPESGDPIVIPIAPDIGIRPSVEDAA